MKRFGVLLLGCSGVALALVGSIPDVPLRLVYNASDSAPRGFYTVALAEHFSVGEYVVIRLPERAAAFAAARGYLPKTVPVLKQIAAVEGHSVCSDDGWIYIDGRPAARALAEDYKRRPLVAWTGCRRLVRDELFLLNTGNRASFDSRYFGPIDASFVRGRATKW